MAYGMMAGDSGVTMGGGQDALKQAVKQLVQSGNSQDQILQWAQQYVQNPYSPDISGGMASTPYLGGGYSGGMATTMPMPSYGGPMLPGQAPDTPGQGAQVQPGPYPTMPLPDPSSLVYHLMNRGGAGGSNSIMNPYPPSGGYQLADANGPIQQSPSQLDPLTQAMLQKAMQGAQF